jgi:hypothetical protein
VRKAFADCPDAETLAALADDTLPAGARREIEAHMADCDRCQALTAAMVRAEPFAGPRADVAVDEVPRWRRRAFNWLVPAAAAATAVALWVLVPGQGTPLPEEPATERQIAATPAAPSSQVITSEPLRIPVEADADSPDSPARERDANVESAPAAAAPPPAAAPAEPSLKAESAVAGSLQASGSDQAAGPERREEGAQKEAVAVPQERALNRQPAPAAALGAAADTAGARAAPAGFDVVSPNPQIRWRIGPGPVVQYSADGGATWAAQQSGAATELTAGSAPASAVCWLVGRGGSVLRTTDGGRQWQRIAFPETVDLTAVTASTALNATVVLADGRRFVTSDGGRTWAPVP